MGLLRTAAYLILIACLLKSISVSAQTLPHISLSVKDEPLENVLQKIQSQTGYTYFIDTILMQHARRVTLSVQSASLDEVLDLCFKSQPFTYKLAGRIIYVRQKDQRVLVQGTVVNEKEEPIGGATIAVKGGKPGVGTMSDDHGAFSLQVVNRQGWLIISCVNYETKIMPMPRDG